MSTQVNYCVQCGAERVPKAQFCHQCGKAIAPQKVSASKASKAQPASNSDKIDTGRLHYRILKAFIATKRKRFYRNGFVTLIMAVFLTVLYKKGGFVEGSSMVSLLGYGAIASYVAAFFLLKVASNMEGMTSGQYYGIQEAKGADGQHRCVFCGHKGIYRKGVYKTEDKIASCSKCKEYLFTE